MRRPFVDLDPASLSSLSPAEAVQFFTQLLWGAAHRHGIPIDGITVTTRLDVADGGIDADIRPNVVTLSQDLLVAGNSFFQIKAGISAAPWQKGWLKRELLGAQHGSSKPVLGQAVRDCLAQRGRYVLVCFGCDPTGSKRRSAIRHIRDIFTAAGFRKSRVDVWGQSTLAGLAQVFPSLVLRYTDRHHLPFLTHDEWRLDAAMDVKLHLGNDQHEVINQIRDCLRGQAIHHVRLIGEPGLGKTRLALEALSQPDLAPTVIYVRNPEDFDRSPLFNALLRSDDQSSVTLVVDDCPPKDRASIWNALRQRSNRIQLVSLDHGPEWSHDELMQIIHCPLLNREQIKGILADYTQTQDLDRWAEFCSGSPRVAHAVGENLRSNPGDILKPVAAVPIWDRFVHGSVRAGSHEEAQHEMVLRHIALFHKFGFETPVEDEAKFIARLAAQADPAITWPQFQSIVKHFRDRRIVQGRTTLFLAPRALHIYLWLQFWEHYGTGVNVRELLGQLPPSLLRWFAEMFKFGHASPKCTERIEDLTGRGGPFDSREFITQGKGAEFLNDLAEAHPDATLRCIERTVGQWSHDELLQFSQSRQYIVWALEKIAIWRDFFQRAAMVLLKLARSENASNSNSATGTFCGLFEMGFDRMASSEAPPDFRLPTLQQGLNAPDAETRAVAIKALGSALADHPHVRIMGPEQQGMRPLPALWSPRTWKEVHDAYRAFFNLAMEFWQTRIGDEKGAVVNVLINAAVHLVRRRPLERDVVVALEAIAADGDTDLRPLIQHLSLWRRLRWRGLSRKTARALRKIEVSIEGSDLSTQITRVVLLGSWEDLDRSKKGEYGRAHSKKVCQLARKASAQPSMLRNLLPRLMVDPGFAVFGFGLALGNADETFNWSGELFEVFTHAGHRRNPELLAGYLSAMFVRARTKWESTVTDLLRDGVLKDYARQLVVGSGLTGAVLDRMCEMVERQELADNSFENFAYARKGGVISPERCVQFISWCVCLARPALVRTALNTAYVMFCFEKTPPPQPEQPLLDLILAPSVLQERDQTHYQWAELTQRYIDHYPRHAMTILESVLMRFDRQDFVLRLIYTQAQATMMKLIATNPHESWNVVTRLMEPLGAHRTWHIAHWLGPRYAFDDSVTAGPLAAFDVDDVLRWVAADPKQRAHFIARECPKTFDGKAGGRLTRQMLIRYGDQEEVGEALWANFGSEGWSGKASEHFRKKRDNMRQWLSAETERPIIEWLQRYIDSLSAQIRDNEIREERRF